MSQNQENETTGDELFLEELGQVQGGRVEVRSRPLLTLGRMEVELGVKEPVFPPGLPRPITTQALHETGPTLPPPRL
ncbi:MAG: hypothetical protein RL685_3582 [Pseudomonadota bacterium]|jgi:hypothetical protein